MLFGGTVVTAPWLIAAADVPPPVATNWPLPADEHFRTLHPPADRDLAVDAWPAGIRSRGLQPVAGRCGTECRFSDHHGQRAVSRRQSQHDGLGNRDAARTAIRHD